MGSRKIERKIELQLDRLDWGCGTTTATYITKSYDREKIQYPNVITSKIKYAPKTLKEYVEVNDICVYDLFKFVKENYKK